MCSGKQPGATEDERGLLNLQIWQEKCIKMKVILGAIQFSSDGVDITKNLLHTKPEVWWRGYRMDLAE